MSISKKSFGVTKDGKETFLYTISNKNGMKAAVSNFGAILVQLIVPDKKGGVRDVVLGFDSVAGYEGNDCFFGSTIGRNANRIGGAEFELDGTTVHLAANENGNNLHTDFDHGFHKAVWNAELLEEENAVRFFYRSPDGENGFPGNLDIKVTYTLQEDNAIRIDYDGVSDKKTVINVTNHSYFNLNGHDSGSICDERVMIQADTFTELGAGSIPTGRILQVEGTPMDLRSEKRVGDEIDADFGQLTLTGGYDHNWVLQNHGNLEKVAQVEDDASGIVMDAYTDLPGVQFYAGNFITPQKGKDGVSYGNRQALCLEMQYFPDSIHHPEFPQPVFDAGQHYHASAIYKFR